MTISADVVSLGELVKRERGSIRTGPFGTTLRASEYTSTGVPVVSVGEVGYGNFRVTAETRRVGPLVLRRLPEYQLRVGDIVFARKGAVDRSACVRDAQDGWFLGSDGIRVRLGSAAGSANPIFIGYALQTSEVRRWLLHNATGTTMATLNQSLLERVPVWVPQRREQDRIAQTIDDASDAVDLLEQLIAKKRDLKQGMMQELLTGRTRLPGFEADWRDVLLGDHVTYLKTVALPREQLDQVSPLRYLHYGDIHTRTSVRLDAAAEPMPRAPGRLAVNAGRLAAGDVVFADASEDPAGVGKSVEVANVPPEGVVPGLHTIAARFDKQVLADGFKAYLQFIPAFRQSLLRLAAGTKVLATTRAYVSSIRLRLPDPAEQRAIAGVLFDIDGEIAALERRLESARAVKMGMMQELLTGRTRLPVEASA